MDDENGGIEIIGISTVGTYPSWIDYTVASFYNHVDKIVVVNNGYDVYRPEDGAIYRLEREHNLLKNIDIHNKILEVNPTVVELEKLFSTKCREGVDEYGRAGNITLAAMTAHNLSNQGGKNRWILKLDSDQVLYRIYRKQLVDLIVQNPKISGFRFGQYADYFHDLDHVCKGLPDDFTNDGALFYRSKRIQRYGSQGSPDIHADQYPVHNIRTGHFRRISPPGVEKYDYYFKRFWYHTYGPNSIMEYSYNRETGKKLTNEEIIKIAHNETIALLRSKGRYIPAISDERIPYSPPEVIKIGALEYIKKGY